MRVIFGIFLAVLVLVIAVFASGAVYVVDETKQVVITQFGEPVGNPIRSVLRAAENNHKCRATF